MGIYNTLIFTEAIDQVEALVKSDNTDEIADRIIEKIAPNADLAMACIMILLFKVKNVDIDGVTGAEMANAQPTVMDLILPPGVNLRGVHLK